MRIIFFLSKQFRYSVELRPEPTVFSKNLVHGLGYLHLL